MVGLAAEEVVVGGDVGFRLPSSLLNCVARSRKFPSSVVGGLVVCLSSLFLFLLLFMGGAGAGAVAVAFVFAAAFLMLGEDRASTERRVRP